jgi:hypothetical protein
MERFHEKDCFADFAHLSLHLGNNSIQRVRPDISLGGKPVGILDNRRKALQANGGLEECQSTIGIVETALNFSAQRLLNTTSYISKGKLGIVVQTAVCKISHDGTTSNPDWGWRQAENVEGVIVAVWVLWESGCSTKR